MHCLVKVKSIIGHKIQLVKEKNCNLIILDLSGEGDENYTEQAIGNMINEYQNKFKTKTIALSQNFLSCNNENIFYYNFAWEHFNKEFRPRRSYQEYKYKYNYLGGYPRKDKLLFFNTLVERKDFKESISSMGTIPKELLQYASPKALSLTPTIIDHDMLYSKHSGEFWKKINENIYNQSRFSLGTFTAVLNSHPGVFSVVAPQASAMSFPRFDLPISSEDLARRLLKEEDVLVVPGTKFGVENHFRFSSALLEDHLQAGLSRFNSLITKVMAGD